MADKIAPVLSWHIQEPFASDPKAFREAIPKMVRELRALKAYARHTRDLHLVLPLPHSPLCKSCRLWARLSPVRGKR